MFVVSRELGRLVRLRHGVVTWPELKSNGMSSGTLRRYLDTGAVVRLHPGIYRFGAAPDTLESRCVAACLADDRVVVSHLTAARLHGLRRVGDDDVVHLIVRGDRVPLSSGVVTHRTKALAAGDVQHRTDHIRFTTALRTAFDLASVLGDLDLESVIEQLLDRRRITVPELHAIGRRLRAPGRTGSARFCRVVCARDGWLRPADSHLEVRMWRALSGSGITGLVRQHPVVLDDGREVQLDIADPGCGWALEIDHVTWHGGRADAQSDKIRDRALRRANWHIERVTDAEVERSLAVLVLELRDSLFALRAIRAAA
jgi:hypothetical protein